MCTISYLPNPEKNNRFTVVDNRDESVNRPAAFPRVYKEYGTQLYYPKDKSAGGTWIGVGRKNRLMALMNGAFLRHRRHPSYRKSRGVVVKELLAANNIIEGAESYDFQDIEPFYGVVFSYAEEVSIFEVIWDGRKTHINFKDKNKPHIWSSAMTYSPEQHAIREKKFRQFLKENKTAVDLSDLLWDFHHDSGAGGREGLLINRGELRTTSVSQFRCKIEGADTFRFEDLISGGLREEPVLWE